MRVEAYALAKTRLAFFPAHFFGQLLRSRVYPRSDGERPDHKLSRNPAALFEIERDGLRIVFLEIQRHVECARLQVIPAAPVANDADLTVAAVG